MAKKLYTVRHHVDICKDYEVWAESEEEAWHKVDDQLQDLHEYEYIDSKGVVWQTDPDTLDCIGIETDFS